MNIRIDAQSEHVVTSRLNNLKTTESREIFPIKVVAVEGETAVVLVNGNLLKVTSRVSLAPGQIFLVKRLQSSEETETWQLLRQVTESNSQSILQSILERLGLPEELENNAIVNVLGRAGLSITEESVRLVQHLIEKAGGFTHINLAAAVASLKLGISFDLLLPFLTPFVEKIAIAQDSLKKDGSKKAETEEKPASLREIINSPEFLGCRLKENHNLLREKLSRLAAAFEAEPMKELQRLTKELGNEQRLLLGGQLLNWGRENIRSQEPFYYIPLFTLFRGEEQPPGEILIYPKSTEKSISKISFVLNIATRHLGWIRVELSLDEGLLRVGMVVEEQAAKQVIDAAWPKLAEVLEELKYNLIWSGCRVGSVSSFSRDLLEGCYYPRIHKTLDLTI